MKITKLASVCFRNLFANRLRSILSMLGIIIGVGSVICLMAIGEGARSQIMNRVTAMGSDLIVIRSGRHAAGGARTRSSDTLNITDAENLLDGVEGVDSVTPQVQKSMQVKLGTANLSCQITGVAPSYFRIRNHPVVAGRAFDDFEVENLERVALLGAEAAKVLAGDPAGVKELLGREVKISGMNFKVIGLLGEKGDQGFFNPDESVVVPFTTAMKRLFGTDRLREIDVKVASDADLPKVQSNIEEAMRRSRKIRAGEDDDFSVRNMAEMVETAAAVTGTMTLLLGAVAAISLVVGGIGIMNIMLVTVTERTREIGIRKAVGGRDGDILMQFLTEATVLSLSGGLIGAGGGASIAVAASKYMGMVPVFRVSHVLVSILFSAMVGIFFGWYPASRAAKLDPIDALARE